MILVREVAGKLRTESVVYRHDTESPDIELPEKNVSVEWITTELVERIIQSEEKRETFRYLLDVGYSGLVAHTGDEWIAYGWICTPESEAVPLHLPDWISNLDLYWLFADKTKKEYRRQGWHKYILAERIRMIYEYDSNASIYIDTDTDNVSRFSMVSVGFEPAGKITTYRFGYPPAHMKKVGQWNWGTPHPPLPHS